MDIGTYFNVEADKCVECGGRITVIQEKGEIVCNDCGLIISERIIDKTNSKARYFNAKEMKSKILTRPQNNILYDIHQSTLMKTKNIKNSDLKRAFKQNNLLNWRQKNFIIASSEIKRITASLRLPNYVKEMTMSLYKRYLKNNALSGRSINGMIAACLYYVCKVNQISRSLKEISNKINLKNENFREVYNSYKSLISELNLKAPPPDPISFVPRYITALRIDPKVESPTIKVIRAFTSRACSTGKDPRGIAAGALYLVCKMISVQVSQKEIAKVAKITNITLCKRYKEIIDRLFEKNKSND